MTFVPTKPAFGSQIRADDFDKNFLSGPGEDLVVKTILQMVKVPGFVRLFGEYNPKNEQQRWADYNRFDWSLRQLPAINIFESNNEAKDSDNAWLNGTIAFQVFWPASFRREQIRRIEVAFKGAMENFFNSGFVSKMLDELYYIQRPEKVFGLNEYGKKLNWVPNAEGIVESAQVPVTIINVDYRIDLRAWNRALEFMNRTVENPFLETLCDLVQIGGEYDGVQNSDPAQIDVSVPDQIKVSNP